MLNNWFSRNSSSDRNIDDNAADDRHAVKKKIDKKKLLLPVMLIGLCTCLGFAVITYMVSGSGKTLRLSPPKAMALPQGRLGALATTQSKSIGIGPTTATAIAALPPSVPASIPSQNSGPVPEKQVPSSDVVQKKQNVTKASKEERDIFTEFYVKHIEPAGDTSGIKRMVDKNMYGLGKIDVHQLEGLGQPIAPPPVEHPKDINIMGITCIGDGDCMAITSEGVLRKGDMVGKETVTNVSDAFFTTDRRVVNW